MTKTEQAMEQRVEYVRRAHRIRNCAQGLGHVTIDSPVCDACGHDVRRPAPVIE